MAERTESTTEKTPTTTTDDGGGVQASIAPNPNKTKTIVSEEHSSDGSYEIIYSDGSGEAGQGGGG